MAGEDLMQDIEIEQEEEENQISLVESEKRNEAQLIHRDEVSPKDIDEIDLSNAHGFAKEHHLAHGEPFEVEKGQDKFIELYITPSDRFTNLGAAGNEPKLYTFKYDDQTKERSDFQSAVGKSKERFIKLIRRYNSGDGYDYKDLQQFKDTWDGLLTEIAGGAVFGLSGALVQDYILRSNLVTSLAKTDEAYIQDMFDIILEYQAERFDENPNAGRNDAWFIASANLFKQLQVLGIRADQITHLYPQLTNLQAIRRYGVGYELGGVDTYITNRAANQIKIAADYLSEMFDIGRITRYMADNKDVQNAIIQARQNLRGAATPLPKMIVTAGTLIASIVGAGMTNIAFGRLLEHDWITLWFQSMLGIKATEQVPPDLDDKTRQVGILVEMIGLTSFGLRESKILEHYPEFKDELTSFGIAHSIYKSFKSTESLKQETIDKLLKKIDPLYIDIRDTTKRDGEEIINSICDTNQITKSGCEIFFKERRKWD